MNELGEYIDYDVESDYENIEQEDVKHGDLSDLEFISSLENPSVRHSTVIEVIEPTTLETHSNSSHVAKSIDITVPINDDDNDNSSTGDDDSDSDDDLLFDKETHDVWLSEDEIAIDESLSLGHLKTKNEIVEDHVDTPSEMYINPKNEAMMHIGKVISRIDSEFTILVESIETHRPLNEGSILALSNGVVIGMVHEVFGPLVKPFYILKWNGSAMVDFSSLPNLDLIISPYALGEGVCESKKVNMSDIIKTVQVDTSLYSVDRLNNYVTPASLRNKKGSDASNFYDEEVLKFLPTLVFYFTL